MNKRNYLQKNIYFYKQIAKYTFQGNIINFG